MEILYLLVDGIIGFSLLYLAVFSLLKSGYKRSVNRLFAAFSILTAVWIVASNMGGDINTVYAVSLISNRVTFAASFGVSIILMRFVLKYSSTKKIEIISNYASPLFWLISLLCLTPFIVKDVIADANTYSITPGPLIFVYVFGLILTIGTIIFGTVRGLVKTNGVKRRQLMSIGLGIAFSLPLVVSINFVIPMLTGNFEITKFGITPLIVLVVCLYYGVVKYSLFDIKLAAIRTSAYALSLLTLSFIYYGMAYIISMTMFDGNINSSVSISPVNIVLALILAFIFQPIKLFFDKVTNKFFYKDNYNTDDFFASLNRTLAFTTDLRSLLERSAYEICGTLKSEQAFFFINTFDDHYVSAGTPHHNHLPKNDASQLELICKKDHKVIVASLLKSNDPIRRLMASHKLEVILPLIQAGEFIGFLCLGYHHNLGYKTRDMKVLETISDELAIAIQNALSIQEVKDLNMNLQQRVNEATRELRASNAQLQRLDKAKDEFVSMASHQLRTPLTSVKGYISMVLEGDAGSVSEMQEHFLSEAFMSSERMVHLINDFLNVSRIQTGKFIIDKTSVDLSKLVEQEIDSLRPSAESRKMKFVYRIPKNFPIMQLDEGKIRQVVMNFADNAIYYSHEDTSIDINLSIENNNVVFTVNDTGIGVPIEAQERLFSKFYRADNAKKQRPDGTGVGIFLAKKVIDAHGGRIVFKSVENKGSTFGFSLPLK